VYFGIKIVIIYQGIPVCLFFFSTDFSHGSIIIVIECFLSRREYEQGHTPKNELQIYTWMDATLGELTQLIKEVIPDVRRRGIQFAFSIVSADDSYNRYYLSEIGKTENGQRRPEDQIQLANKRFHVGDYLDVAIIHKRQEQQQQQQQPSSTSTSSLNHRRDRIPQQSSDDNNKRRSGPSNERNGGSTGGPVRSAPRNDHRDRPY
jgi:histone deacetylase complex subunit SAP18